MAAAVQGFLKNVLKSGLMDRRQLQAAVRSSPRAVRHDSEALAEHFVRTGVLSRFQVKKLLSGAALGLVLGPYQILAPIGRGGMGSVFLARDGRSKLLVALKILSPKRAREEERVRARFEREMEMSQRVAHPHVAWTYECGIHRGAYFIAMEYIPGKNLSQLVQERGKLDVPRAARLFAEIASGIGHAHLQGLIHRDLKPSNVMITPHDHAKVLDLGLALIQGEEAIDPEVVDGQRYVVGTMDYIAPEQAQNSTTVDPRGDIYSLGCSMFFALTGRPPFPGGTAKEKIKRHRKEEPPDVEEFNPDVPTPLAEFLARMMAKRPDDRPSHAQEVEAILRAFVSAEPVLPLDAKDDPEYAAAVARLETADGLSAFEMDIVSPAVKNKRNRRSGRLPTLHPDKGKKDLGPSQTWDRLGLAFIGVLSLLLIGGLVVIIALLRTARR